MSYNQRVATSIIGGIVALLLVIVFVSLANSARGFNDPAALAKAIASATDAKQTDGTTVDITCVHAGGTQFTCIGVWSDGRPNEVDTVTVSPDGNTWIAH